MKKTLKKIAKLYSKNLNDLGACSRSVGWRDKESHTLRFEKLIQVFNNKVAGKKISVNDLGCGYGAMYFFLKEKPNIKIKRYFGYEISQEMLVMAKKMISSPVATFIKSGRILRKTDYSFTSGIFNVRFDANENIWQKYIQDTLINMNNMSRRGFAFNALTTYVDYKEPHLYYADPFFWFDFCKKRFSKHVSLLHDYKLWEWTIIVKKEPQK